MLRKLLVLSVAATTAVAQTPRHRAILVSFDGFSEEPARMFIDSVNTPTIWSLFRTAACADGARPAFVSVTPSGHAAIYTGAYSNVNGIAAIANGALPLARTTILETTDGYSAPPLSAEPIWIAAARQGKRVFSQMSTQSPGPPGYLVATEATPELDRARARAAAANQRWELAAINVYNEKVADAQLITEAAHPPREARGWKGLASLGGQGTVTSREVSWAFGGAGDSVHALFVRSSAGAAAVVLSTTRDASRGVFARVAPVDTSAPGGRPLARHFSEALRIDLAGGRRAFIYARLFALSSDLSRFSIFVSEARVAQGNRPEVARDYNDRVEGVPGNGASGLMERGGFGPTLLRGGDGTAELMYLETAELVVRQFMRGTDAGWARYAPDLLVDYLPYPDEALHSWYGLASPLTPGVSPTVRAGATRMLKRAYQLVDQRLLQLQRMADGSRGTVLVVTGEHGMRASWATFRPNVLLRDAGLLAADSSGRIDLAHTQAAATRGWWISVNRDTRREGIVPRDSVDAVLGRVEQVLRAARDSTGSAIVTQIWRSDSPAVDSLGLGGPAGGDLYYGLARGYYPNAGAQGKAVSWMTVPRGEHGFPSVDRDMWPAVCVHAAGVAPKRIGPVRTIDIAPTVSAWLGIKPPAESRGNRYWARFGFPNTE